MATAGQQQAERHSMEGAKLAGRQRAVTAENGIDVSGDAAISFVDETYKDTQADLYAITTNAGRQAANFGRQAANYGAEARSAMPIGYMKATGALFSTVSKVSARWAPSAVWSRSDLLRAADKSAALRRHY